MEIEKLTGWRDIETAPKDGTWFIAFGGGLDRPTPMKWCDRVGAWECDAVMLEDWDDQSEGYSRPKLWFAIPAPPGTTRAPADLRSALEAETMVSVPRALLAPFAALADEWDRWQAKGSTSTPNMVRMSYGRVQFGLPEYQAVRTALAPTKGDQS